MTPEDRAMLMIYTSVKDRLKNMGVGLLEFLELLKDWDVVPLTNSGRVVGGVLIKGNEVHIGYGVKPKASIRGHLRATLKEVLDKYGYATTVVEVDNLAGLRFCERLGFVKLSTQDGRIRLRCDRSDYV
jgi:RimJ/RimL family protein N-acetyltransferase